MNLLSLEEASRHSSGSILAVGVESGEASSEGSHRTVGDLKTTETTQGFQTGKWCKERCFIKENSQKMESLLCISTHCFPYSLLGKHRGATFSLGQEKMASMFLLKVYASSYIPPSPPSFLYHSHWSSQHRACWPWDIPQVCQCLFWNPVFTASQKRQKSQRKQSADFNRPKQKTTTCWTNPSVNQNANLWSLHQNYTQGF